MDHWKTAALLGFGLANGVAMFIALFIWFARHHPTRRPTLHLIPLTCLLVIEAYILFDFPAVVPRSEVVLAAALLLPLLSLAWFLFLRWLAPIIGPFLNRHIERLTRH